MWVTSISIRLYRSTGYCLQRIIDITGFISSSIVRRRLDVWYSLFLIFVFDLAWSTESTSSFSSTVLPSRQEITPFPFCSYVLTRIQHVDFRANQIHGLNPEEQFIAQEIFHATRPIGQRHPAQAPTYRRVNDLHKSTILGVLKGTWSQRAD